MAKKVIIILVCIFLSIAASASVVLIRDYHVEPKSADQEMLEMMERIDNAVYEMNDNYEKQSEVVAFPTTYSDADGNTIVFTQCHTKYYGGNPTEVTGLHTEAIGVVIEIPEEHQDCVVNGASAAWFEKDSRAYLCWTISPEISCILEYNPESVSEADIYKMAESVQEHQKE